MRPQLPGVTTLLVAVLAAAGALAACGGGGGGGTKVGVTLKEWSVTPDAPSAPAGKVTFRVHNGGAFVHQLVVDREPDVKALPTKSSGAVDERAIPAARHIGEVTGLDPGSTKNLTVDLAAGKYVLFCNRVDGTTSHFAKGMHAVFTVKAAA